MCVSGRTDGLQVSSDTLNESLHKYKKNCQKQKSLSIISENRHSLVFSSVILLMLCSTLLNQSLEFLSRRENTSAIVLLTRLLLENISLPFAHPSSLLFLTFSFNPFTDSETVKGF